MGGRFTHLAWGGGLALSVCLVGGFVSPAKAQALDSKYWLELGAFWPDVDTTIRVAGPNGNGSTIDLEQDLDLGDRETLFSVYGGARLSKHWTLIGEYYALDRTGSKVISRPLVFDDVTYDSGVTVASKFATDVYRMAIGYSFYRTDRAEIGAALGAHITNFDVELAGTGHVGNAAASSQQRKRDALAPLPTIGLYGGYAVTPKFIVKGRFDWLSLNIGDYDGRLTNTEVSAVYHFTDHFGAGAGYRYVDYTLGITKSNWNGEFAYTFKGPTAFLSITF